jgi:hypothetical protein
MSLEDVEYYRRRAREERELAAKADSAEAATAHSELAMHYEGLVEHLDLLPRTRTETPNP